MVRALVHMIVVCAMLAAGSRVLAADSIEVRPLHFAKGTSSTTVKGSLKGHKTVDYKLRARAGQTMTVSLKTSNAANYFNVLPRGSKDVAIFVGSTSGNEWTGQLEADGEYTVRVYLMRSAARRNETANFTLSVGIAGSVTGLKPEQAQRYRDLHAHPWRAVGRMIKECDIRNFSIHEREIDGKLYLFAYLEYTGKDFDADMKKMAADPETHRWWQETDPCQLPLPDAAARGKIWADTEEVYYLP